MLEAAVVRCAQNRAESRYDVECINAREAVKIIEAREEVADRARLEAESERKRQALRRTQQAAEEARRRAEEERRRQEEAEYHAQFGDTLQRAMPPGAVPSNAPVAVLPEPPAPAEPINSPYDDPMPVGQEPGALASSAAEVEPSAAELTPPAGPEPASPVPSVDADSDLASIRETLRERTAGDQG